MKLRFSVEGMSCSACQAAVERVTKRVDGVESVQVSLLAKSMSVEASNDSPELVEAITAAVGRAGFTASLITEKKGLENGNGRFQDKDEKNKNQFESMKTRLFLSIAFLAVLMYLTMGHMVGLPVPHIFHGTENLVIFSFTQFLLTLPIVFLNRKFFRVGTKALLAGAPNMDTLVAVGSGAALVYGIFAIFMIGYGLGHGDTALAEEYGANLYFESAATILTLVSVGKTLEERSKNKTGAAVDRLMSLAPDVAFVEKNGEVVEVKASELAVGDIVVIKPGQSLPADGVIVEGASSVDESALTGESIPVEKNVGDRVMAASINKNGSFKFRADSVGNSTILSEIIELVKDAGASKAPIARLADKVSGIFVPIVMSIAVAAFAFWMIMGKSFDFALSTGISVLVISCPCALGLATPVAITVSVGKLAEAGFLVKSAETVERLCLVKNVVLDKTGTVTEGHPSVTDIISDNKERLLKIAASLERMSEHPLAEAICAYTDSLNIQAEKAEDFSASVGRGVRGIIDGELCCAGNLRYMEELSVKMDQKVLNEIEKLSSAGRTPMIFAANGEYIGIIAVSDRIKESSAEAISRLEKMGIGVTMLTGDNYRTAAAIAAEAGIGSFEAELLPADKEKKVSAIKKDKGIVAFVGDGINDSPALAAADIGIAVGSGADIAIDSADAVLMKSGLEDIPAAVKFSKETMRNIKQNLFWAFFYNTLGIPVAAGALSFWGITLSPMIGAAAMSLSSLFVVSNALRLRTKKIV